VLSRITSIGSILSLALASADATFKVNLLGVNSDEIAAPATRFYGKRSLWSGHGDMPIVDGNVPSSQFAQEVLRDVIQLPVGNDVEIANFGVF
jgi:hypothetical protein